MSILSREWLLFSLYAKGKKEINTYESEYVVEYKNVCFSYGKKEVLHDVSFGLKENSMTALVGKSGSGKSTIANLLVRFWDINSGTIYIGGIDIKELPLSVLMNQISMVFQNVYLFEDTIYNNILICKMVGVASTSSVYAHLKILEEKGYIARKMDASRAIAIL